MRFQICEKREESSKQPSVLQMSELLVDVSAAGILFSIPSWFQRYLSKTRTPLLKHLPVFVGVPCRDWLRPLSRVSPAIQHRFDSIICHATLHL